MIRNRLTMLAFAMSLAFAPQDDLLGQEVRNFRIDTEVFSGNKSEPISENLTLFQNGVVYDFRFEPGENRTLKEVVVFRVGANGAADFALIDVEREVQLRMNAGQVYELVDKLRESDVLRQRAPEMLEPKFDERWDAESGTLTLTSDAVDYVATGTRTGDPGAVDQYHTFVNWYTRLNAADPRKMPPFPRLILNDAVERRGMIPERVELTVKPSATFARPIKAQSRHYVVWALSRTDQDYIRKAQDMFGYREVNRAGYFRLASE